MAELGVVAKTLGAKRGTSRQLPPWIGEEERAVLSRPCPCLLVTHKAGGPSGCQCPEQPEGTDITGSLCTPVHYTC